jgi:hypothetical protein
MKKNTSLILILSGILLIVFFFILMKRKEAQRSINPYEFSVEEFKQVEEDQISHQEVKRIKLTHAEPQGLSYHAGDIYILYKAHLQIIDVNGKQKQTIRWTDAEALCVKALPDNRILIAYSGFLRIYNAEGEMLQQSESLPEESSVTSLAVSQENIFAADGGRREVLIFDLQLQLKSSFKGESGVSSLHGFILPGNQFSLDFNQENELWISNPGVHQLQNYTEEGRLRGGWGEASFGPEGFSGCCNPTYFAFLNDGRFVTSEKGLVRVKIHRESGEFLSYIAPPAAFGDGNTAPAIAVDEQDNIILLDFEQLMVRIFHLK